MNDFFLATNRSIKFNDIEVHQIQMKDFDVWATHAEVIKNFIKDKNHSDEILTELFSVHGIQVISTITINWLLEGVAKTAVSNAQGKFTGDATGEINYATGKGKIIPVKLPQKNTQFTVIYNFGEQLNQTKSAIAPDSNQKLSFTIGTGAAIQPNSVELSIPVNHSTKNVAGTVILNDVPINSSTGNLVTNTGNIQGVINYSTGAVEVTPFLIKKEFISIYIPTTVYGSA